MKHKVCCRLCAIVIAVSAVMGIYVRSVQAPLRAQTYTISPWETLYVFAARPAFWSCSGILVALALLRLRVGPRPRKVLLWCGTALIAAYCAAAALHFMGAPGRAALPQSLLPWLSGHPAVFLLPGMLIGSGIDERAP